MDPYSLILTVVIGLILASVTEWALTLSERLTAMERLYQEALAWSDKYQLDAASALALLAKMRQQYAVLQSLYDEAVAREQAEAWRVGLRVRK